MRLCHDFPTRADSLCLGACCGVEIIAKTTAARPGAPWSFASFARRAADPLLPPPPQPFCLLLLALALTAATAQRLDDATKLTAPRGPAAPAPRFLLGYNLGNVRFLPFSRAPLNHTADELRSMLLDALDDMADAGANAVRFWLHIDGSTNPEFDKDGLVSGMSLDTVNDLKWFLQGEWLFVFGAVGGLVVGGL